MLEARERAGGGKAHGWAMRCLGSVRACLQTFFTNRRVLRENVVFVRFEMKLEITAMEGLVTTWLPMPSLMPRGGRRSREQSPAWWGLGAHLHGGIFLHPKAQETLIRARVGVAVAVGNSLFAVPVLQFVALRSV